MTAQSRTTGTAQGVPLAHKIVMMRIDDLKPYPGNPRTWSATDIANLKEGITHFDVISDFRRARGSLYTRSYWLGRRDSLRLVLHSQDSLRINFSSIVYQIRKMQTSCIFRICGWGGGIRTPECQVQNLVPYRLATPHGYVDCSKVLQ